MFEAAHYVSVSCSQIAYVMKYHHMSLVDAYLLVRSRRLSILIRTSHIFVLWPYNIHDKASL